VLVDPVEPVLAGGPEAEPPLLAESELDELVTDPCVPVASVWPLEPEPALDVPPLAGVDGVTAPPVAVVPGAPEPGAELLLAPLVGLPTWPEAVVLVPEVVPNQPTWPVEEGSR
jgi:hypothetical protein